jgi:hypothetical protein
MTADSTHCCYMCLVPLLGESFFIHATQIQTQRVNGYFTKKYEMRELMNLQFFRKCTFLNINMKLVRFFNIYVEVKQIKKLYILCLKKWGYSVSHIPQKRS